MSTYLGFEPTGEKDFNFVSYNTEDCERVGNVARILSEMVPIWYDYGIEYGDKWEETISEKITDSKNIILFFTKGILAKSDSFAQKEFRMAKRMGKRILIVFLDSITNADVPKKKLVFWDDIIQIQNIDISHMKDVNEACREIIRALGGNTAGRTKVSGTPETRTATQGSFSEQERPAAGEKSAASAQPMVTDLSEMEPDIEVKVLPPHKLKIFGTGYTTEEKEQIRKDGVKLLRGFYKELNDIVNRSEVDGVDAYRLSKSAMIIISEQLGVYNFWKYEQDQAMNLFKKNYEANLNDIGNYVRNNGRMLSPDIQKMVKQLLHGLDDVIRKLER